MKPFEWMLAAVVVYLPYQQHYPLVLPIKGVNIINVLFLAIFIVIVSRKEKTASATPCKGRFTLLFFALVASFIIGESYDSSRMEQDATLLKDHIFYMLFYFLFFHAVREVRTARIVLGAIVVATLLVSLQGVRQAFDYGIGNFNPNKRVTGPFGGGMVGGANMAAGYYVIFLPVCLWVYYTWKSALGMRLLALAATLLGVFATFYTYSRQAYILLAAIFTLESIRRSILVAVLLVTAVASYEAWVPEGVLQRIDMTEQKTAEGDEKLDESTESRFLLWGGAWQIFSSRPWGTGLNHFHVEIGQYVPNYAGYDAHNGYMLMLAEGGVLGEFAMIWLLLSLLLFARKVEKIDDSEDSRLLGGALNIAMVGVFCTNLFGSRIFNGEVMANLWVLAGVTARYYTLKQEQRAREGAPAPKAAGEPRGQAAAIAERIGAN